MIAKTFFLAKTLCTYAMRIFRQRQSLRDHARQTSAHFSGFIPPCRASPGYRARAESRPKPGPEPGAEPDACAGAGAGASKPASGLSSQSWVGGRRGEIDTGTGPPAERGEVRCEWSTDDRGATTEAAAARAVSP